MRRLVFIAVFAGLAVLPAFCQVRGRGRVGPAMSRPGFGGATVSRAPGFAPTVRGGIRFSTVGRFGSFGRPVFFAGRFHHHNHFFFRGGFYFPFYAYPYYPAYYSAYPAVVNYDYSSQYDEQRVMGREIDRLSYEVERLREEEAARAYASAPPAAPQAESRQAPEKPTVLVFRDKHIQEVENYAISGETLWVFNEQRAKKIPLSELDVPATTKLNEERGLEFKVPAR